MSKLTKEELISKVSEISDQDLSISLMEDITDSFVVAEDDTEKEVLKSEVERLTSELEDLKTKYKERFLNGIVEEPKDIIPENPEMVEKEIIDVKEI